MAIAETLEKAIEKAQQAVVILEQIEQIPLPRNIKEAIAEQWVLEALVIGVRTDETYGKDSLIKDRSRCIRLGLALEIFEGLEDKMLEGEVTDRRAIVFRIVPLAYNAWELIKANAETIWQAVQIIVVLLWEQLGHVVTTGLPTGSFFKELAEMWEWFKFTVMASILGIVGTVFVSMMGVADAAAITDHFRKTIKLARRAVQDAETAALPQRNVKRVYRRKESRL